MCLMVSEALNMLCLLLAVVDVVWRQVSEYHGVTVKNKSGVISSRSTLMCLGCRMSMIKLASCGDQGRLNEVEAIPNLFFLITLSWLYSSVLL